jgi:hypothetical protein
MVPPRPDVLAVCGGPLWKRRQSCLGRCRREQVQSTFSLRRVQGSTIGFLMVLAGLGTSLSVAQTPSDAAAGAKSFSVVPSSVPRVAVTGPVPVGHSGTSVSVLPADRLSVMGHLV